MKIREVNVYQIEIEFEPPEDYDGLSDALFNYAKLPIAKVEKYEVSVILGYILIQGESKKAVKILSTRIQSILRKWQL